MTTTNNLGLYIHVPFCVKKCRYCDFLSFGCSDSKVLSEYTKALMLEIKLRAKDWQDRVIDTVFIGGGTPSLLSPWDIGKLMDCLRENFNITEDAEITIEANPATLTDDKMERYLRKGINRLSIGVQSFDNNMLRILGRIHSKNDAYYCVKRAQKLGFKNINIDLMFGIPGQTMKMWKDSVREAIFMRPTHISLYSLQVEEGTEIYKMIYQDGSMDLPDEEMDRDMYHTALRMMKSAGYDHYEISNGALNGYQSRHNLKYWSYEEYLGLGLGASSFVDGSRFKNCDHMFDYIEALKNKVAPVDAGSVENYSEDEEMAVYTFTGLRKSEGISLEKFWKTFRHNFFNVYDRSIVEKYKGKLILDGDRLYLSEEGMDISNQIMAEFL